MCLIREILKRVPVLLTLAACAFGFAGPSDAQNFAQPKVLLTGNWPTAVYAADVNGDGLPDLLYVDGGATPAASMTHVLLNDGTGNFTPAATVATAGDSIAIGDLTGQGHVDIGWLTVTNAAIAGQYTTTLTIAPGRGDGTFAANVTQSFVTAPALPYEFHYLQAGRLHPTGALDVVAGDVKTGIVLDFLHTNSGTPASWVQILHPPDGVGPMTIMDLNGDGANDLEVNSSTAHTAQVILGFPAGGFPTGGIDHAPGGFTSFPGISGVYSLVIRDVNLDGWPDLIAEGANGHIDVFFGNGDGTFQSISSGGTGSLDGTTGNGGHLIAIADLNHDGLPDALTATPVGISTLLGNGTAYLGLNGIYNAGPGRASYASADFNGDGNLDLAVDSPEGVAVLFGNLDGSFQTSRAFAAGQPALSGALGAFHAGGSLDAVVSTAAQQAQLLLGDGHGNFTYLGSPAAPTPTSAQIGAAGLWSTVQVGDLDGDGKLDLLLTADGSAALLPKTADGAVVQLGDGAGGFAVPQPLAASTLVSCPQAPGLLYGASTLASSQSGPAIVNRTFDGARFYPNGNGSLPQNAMYNGYMNGSAVCGPFAHDLVIAAPFDASGVPDVIVQADGRLVMFPSAMFGGPLARASGDLSQDGSLTTAGQLVAPQLSSIFNGSATSTSAGGLGFPAFIGSAAVADLDRDGHNDLLVTYANLSANLRAPTSSAPNYIYIWYGSGGGKFLTSAAHPVNPVRLKPSRNFYQVALADVNADGVPDLILSDGYVLSVQLGEGSGSFGVENHSLAGQGINSISVGDVNGDGQADLVLANGGAVLANPVANLETLAANAEVNTGGITVLLNHATLPANSTEISLLLCVDGPGSKFPCGNPLSSTPLLSPITMYFGQVLDGTALEPTGGLTGGTINFLENNVVFCAIPATLQGGGNACPPTAGDFPAGSFEVHAAYSGYGNNGPGTSNQIQVQVLQDLTNATIASSAQTAVEGTPVTFTAKVTGNFAVPDGAVQFLDGTGVIGTGTLDATGAASLRTSSLTVGPHVVSLAYAGNANFLSRMSSGVTVVITAVGAPPPAGPPSFTLSVTPAPLTLGVGRTGVLRVTVTAVNGFAQPVALTCSGLPNETGCTFVNATVAPGGGSTTLQFTTSAPHNCGDPNHPYFLGNNESPGAARIMWAGLVVFAGGLFRVRRGSRRAGLMVLLAGTLVGLSMMSGCGNCTDLGTRPGSYTFTVSASAQGGPVSETASQVIPLTMTIP